MVWAALLIVDPPAERSAVMYVPSLTAAEVPGRGPRALADAYATGGISLLRLSAENLLGVRVDRHLELSDRDALALLRGIAPLQVDVPGEVRVPSDEGDTEIVFPAGMQGLEADELVSLLYRTGEEGDPISLGPRHLAVWTSMFRAAAEDPERIEAALGNAVPAFRRSDDEPEEIVGFLASFLEERSNPPALRSLPVSPLEVPGDSLYVAEEDEVEAFVTDLAGEDLAFGELTRVQILNGVGRPGLGQDVAERLIGKGFKVSLTGNARSLDHRATLIITYDPSSEGQARAARAQELLGVGEVQVSVQEQGIVDLTIVIGRDFLRTL